MTMIAGMVAEEWLKKCRHSALPPQLGVGDGNASIAVYCTHYSTIVITEDRLKPRCRALVFQPSQVAKLLSNANVS